MMQLTAVPRKRRSAYIKRDDVEFLHVGHAAQNSENAAVPQQQAACQKYEGLC